MSNIILLTTLIIIGGISLLIFLVYKIKIKFRKSEFEDWKIGDEIKFHDYNELFKLRAWSLDGVFVNYKNGIKQMNWSNFDYNHTAIWRRNEVECKKQMGIKPDFTTPNEKYNGGVVCVYNGKPIEILTETECNIFLQECLKNEDYEMAENIRKQLEKYK